MNHRAAGSNSTGEFFCNVRKEIEPISANALHRSETNRSIWPKKVNRHLVDHLSPTIRYFRQ